MTTPPTPADWYPDPDGGDGLRYWDGSAWTEHRAPAPPAEPAAPAAPVEPEHVAHVPEFPASEQPTTVVPLRDSGDQATSVISTGLPSAAPEPEPTPEWVPATVAPTFGAPPLDAPPLDAPPLDAPSFDSPPSFGSTPQGPPPFGTPPGPAVDGDSGGDDGNRKLIITFASAVGALLLILILLLVYAFVIRDHSPGVTVSPSTPKTSSTTKTTTTEASETETETTTAAPGQVTEGDFTFSVARTDTGDTVTSSTDESIQKTANGEYVVVYLTVGNTGTSPVTFLSALQVLNTDDGTYSPDVEASSYLDGGATTIDPGAQAEVAVAFDVPVGTTGKSIVVVGTPGETGVALPL